MDEESLFRDIHSHLLRQSREGVKIDTEHKLADRFQVSRYQVRRVLAVLSQMGVLERTQKRGISISTLEPEMLSRQIESQIKIGRFDARELYEARNLFDYDLLTLAVRRMTPAALSELGDIYRQMEGCIEFRGAALKLHQKFWQTIFEAAGNRVLQVMATALLVHSIDYLDKHSEELPPVWYSDMLAADGAVLEAIKTESLEKGKEAVEFWLSRAILLH